jgi:hypothetical protein
MPAANSCERPKTKRLACDLDAQEARQFLLAASRLALRQLEACCPGAPETALLMLAIQKVEGVPTAEG